MIEEAEETSQLSALERVSAALEEEAVGVVRTELAALHASEVADLLESLPAGERSTVFTLLEPGTEGDVLSHANDSVRAALLEDMAPHQVAAATHGLDTDDAVDILQDLPEERIPSVLRSLDEQRRDRITEALTYPEDSAGGLMNPDVLTLRPDVTLEVALRYLRLQADLVRRSRELAVVDRANRYLGAVRLVELLVHDPADMVGDLLDPEAASVEASTTAAEVARIFEQRDLIMAAVVDDKGTLLGEVTIDDVVDVIREQSDHSLRGLAGLGEDQDTFAPVGASARRRAVWLGINLATAFLAAWVIGRFEATIQEIVALAILMPVVASMGGIAGGQTLTLVIRGLALGHIGPANARLLLRRELAVACLNAALWGVIVGVAAWFWFDNQVLGVVIAVAMVVNLLCAAVAGALIPLVMKRMAIDPAIAGGVVLTTVTDVIGFCAFLGIATVVML